MDERRGRHRQPDHAGERTKPPETAPARRRHRKADRRPDAGPSPGHRRRKTEPGSNPAKPDTCSRKNRTPGTPGNWTPTGCIPDRAFTSARNSRRTVMRIMMHPKALAQLHETLRKTGMARTTGFDPAPSPPGLVPAYSARYRGVPLATARELEGRMLAEYTDGSVEYMETGTAETGTGETGEHPA